MLFFFLFQCFEETEYQTKSKRNETFGNMIFSSDKTQVTWTLHQESHEAVMRVEGAPLGRAPCLAGPSVLHRRTPSSYIYLRTPKRSEQELKTQFHRRKFLYPRDPILGLVPDLRRKRAVITEGFYIIIASPMKCE